MFLRIFTARLHTYSLKQEKEPRGYVGTRGWLLLHSSNVVRRCSASSVNMLCTTDTTTLPCICVLKRCLYRTAHSERLGERQRLWLAMKKTREYLNYQRNMFLNIGNLNNTMHVQLFGVDFIMHPIEVSDKLDTPRYPSLSTGP